MQRQNFRNIGNNFIQGGVQQAGSSGGVTPARATRSSANANQAPEVSDIQSIAETSVNSEDVICEDSGRKDISDDDLLKLKKINFKKKISGKEKRLRQNRKLVRMLTPRNAIAALNELHGQSVNESVVVPTQGNKFEAEITINNVSYKGIGNSKMQAKNCASEKALRDLVITKFKNYKAIEPFSCTKTSETEQDDVSMEEEHKDDDVPMLQLASYALHKLFSEWEAEGFEIPFPKNNTNQPSAILMELASELTSEVPKVAEPKPPKIRTELPPNNLTMHPVMLLSIMRPCTQYSDLGSQGITPNITHSVGATVDGQNFIGSGRSKKEARKRVATEILIKLFDWKGSCC